MQNQIKRNITKGLAVVLAVSTLGTATPAFAAEYSAPYTNYTSSVSIDYDKLTENPKTHTFDTNADYGEDYTWTTTAKTGYYYLRYTLTDHEVGQTQYRSTDTELWNRTGHLWDFSFSAVGKTLPMPRADWVKGTINKRPSNLADTYYATYQDETGIILIRALYDVHHIQPLSYGGSNDYSNLIHLPKDLHSQVTGWFNGY